VRPVGLQQRVPTVREVMPKVDHPLLTVNLSEPSFIETDMLLSSRWPITSSSAKTSPLRADARVCLRCARTSTTPSTRNWGARRRVTVATIPTKILRLNLPTTGINQGTSRLPVSKTTGPSGRIRTSFGKWGRTIHPIGSRGGCRETRRSWCRILLLRNLHSKRKEEKNRDLPPVAVL
jgi:hypothetical protein